LKPPGAWPLALCIMQGRRRASGCPASESRWSRCAAARPVAARRAGASHWLELGVTVTRESDLSVTPSESDITVYGRQRPQSRLGLITSKQQARRQCPGRRRASLSETRWRRARVARRQHQWAMPEPAGRGRREPRPAGTVTLTLSRSSGSLRNGTMTRTRPGPGPSGA
jgi:hypothetical protein